MKGCANACATAFQTRFEILDVWGSWSHAQLHAPATWGPGLPMPFSLGFVLFKGSWFLSFPIRNHPVSNKINKTPTHLCTCHVDTAALSPKFCSGVRIRSVQNRFHMKGWEDGKVTLVSRVQRPKSHVATSSYLSVWICCVWWDSMQKHH